MNNNLMNRDNNENLSNNFNAYNGNAGGNFDSNGGDSLFNTVVTNTQPEPAAPPANGLAIAGMVLGIVSLVLLLVNNLFPEISIPGSLVTAIVGLVLSCVAKKRGNNTGIRKAGFITSLVGTVLNGALAAALFALCGCASCALCSGLMAGI